MKIKICGITNLDDALAAVEAGADMLGYNFYPRSKRYLSVEACTQIQEELHQHGARMISVGVFVNASVEDIIATMEACDLDLAQLHGDEPPALLESLGERVFKAIRPQSAEEALAAIQQYPHREKPPALLIDAYHPSEYGGSGQTGDWNLACELASRIPVLLAGGLTPENVRVAIEQVQPWGVDVASGIESSPGIKDHARVRQFIEAARL